MPSSWTIGGSASSMRGDCPLSLTDGHSVVGYIVLIHHHLLTLVLHGGHLPYQTSQKPVKNGPSDAARRAQGKTFSPHSAAVSLRDPRSILAEHSFEFVIITRVEFPDDVA